METLSSAVVESLLDHTVGGVQDWRKMEDLSSRHKSGNAKSAEKEAAKRAWLAYGRGGTGAGEL